MILIKTDWNAVLYVNIGVTPPYSGNFEFRNYKPQTHFFT